MKLGHFIILKDVAERHCEANMTFTLLEMICPHPTGPTCIMIIINL